MPRLMAYDSAAMIPLHLEAQIRSLLQAEWPGKETGAPPPLTEPELHPVYFILADNDQLLSYARTIWATVFHLEQNFKLYGLGDVLTEPQARGRGYGSRIVEKATSHIRSDSQADVAVLLTEPKLEPFYRRSGWECVPGLQVATKESHASAAGSTIPMMLFLSPRAKAAREIFSRDILVLPGDEW